MIHIFSDSTCDLSSELIAKYQIHILPLHVHLGNEEFLDGVDISPDEIYAWSEQHRTTPKTAAVAVADAIDQFGSVLMPGDEIICFCISEQMSTTWNNLRLAAEELDAGSRIHIINSENLSTGVGLQVLEAAEMAQAGHTVPEILAQIESIRDRVRASFVVDTLVYLHRGGRCSGIAAFAGSKLKLHPMIRVENGKMLAGKKYRGAMNHVLMAYAHDLEPALKKAKPDRVFITHSGCPEENVAEIFDYLKNLDVFREICVTRAGSVISSHCGPGTLGVLFIGEEC